MTVIEKVLVISPDEYNSSSKSPDTMYIVYSPEKDISVFLGASRVSNIEKVSELKDELIEGKFYLLFVDDLSKTLYYKYSTKFIPVVDFKVKSIGLEDTSTVISYEGRVLRVISIDSLGNISEDDVKFMIDSQNLSEIDCRFYWKGI